MSSSAKSLKTKEEELILTQKPLLVVTNNT